MIGASTQHGHFHRTYRSKPRLRSKECVHLHAEADTVVQTHPPTDTNLLAPLSLVFLMSITNLWNRVASSAHIAKAYLPFPPPPPCCPPPPN